MVPPKPLDENEERLMDLIACTVGEVVKVSKSDTDTTIRELANIVRELATSTAVTNETIKTMALKVEKHDQILKGDDQVGLVGKLEQLLPLVEEHQNILRGDGNNDQGLVGRVIVLENKREEDRKPVWIAITSVITFAITYLMDKFVH